MEKKYNPPEHKCVRCGKPDLKPCPFCGAILEYEEHVAILVQGQPTLQLWAHPAGECILSGLEVPKEDHEAWNRRTE